MDNLTVGNPIAHRVRVYYTGSDTLVEGEPLCYSFKTTRSWFGGTVNNEGEVTASEYVAEGSHNASKYMCVESPMRVSSTAADSTDGSNVITEDGDEIDNLQVGMAVSIASASEGAFDGNYVITAINTTTNAITLDMTAAEAAAVTTETDVTIQIDNISSPAGVVAKGGWCGKAGPRVIDIYVPNGAVVPVRTDQNCVLGRTVLAIHTNEQFLTAPHRRYAHPIAVAWETVDRGTTAGLVLAKLDTRLFIWQTGDTGALEIDDKDTTSDIVVNRIKVKSLQTGGQFTALHISAESAAGASTANQRGMALKVEGLVTASVAATVIGTTLALEITGGTVGEYASACQIKLYESSATISSMSGALSVLNLCAQVSSSPAANTYCWVYFESHGTEDPDFLFKFIAAAEVPMATTSDETVTHKIPIRVASSTYYLCVATIA